MVTIVHYEVYTDQGSGWRLEERFALEQRYEALNLAKEKEKNHVKVKIIKEDFDVQDNSYQETVEYISTPKAVPLKNTLVNGDIGIPINTPAGNNKSSVDTVETQKISEAGRAFVKSVVIVLLSLIFVNILVSLLMPIIEQFIPEDLIRPMTFVLFFTLFLGITVPVLITKIPWQVFTFHRNPNRISVPDVQIYDQAEKVIRWYNLNDEIEPAIAPVFPEAPLEYKKKVVSFLTDIIAQVDSVNYLQDSFSKLGIKLIIYGGCFELARSCHLHLGEANSLLFESFKILDGEKTDIESFYEAKKSYKDNKIAIFLAGVGAYLMSQVLKGSLMNINLLKQGFSLWEKQNEDIVQQVNQNENNELGVDLPIDCYVNIHLVISFEDEYHSDNDEETAREEIRDFINNLIPKYNGFGVIEESPIISIRFSKLNYALCMATEFYRELSLFSEEKKDKNYQIHAKCTITDFNPDEKMISDGVKGLFEQTYENEILTTQKFKEIYDTITQSKYTFDYLGEKQVDGLENTVDLYQIVYQSS